MKSSKETMLSVTVTRVLLGLLMLIPGLAKLFMMGPSAIVGMLSSMGFPAPGFFAWVLILAEIIFGLAILANYKLRLTTIPPIIIMVVAGLLTFDMSALPNFLMHLTIAAMYWVYGSYDND